MNENTVAELRRTHPNETTGMTDSQLLEAWQAWNEVEPDPTGSKPDFAGYLTEYDPQPDAPAVEQAALADEDGEGVAEEEEVSGESTEQEQDPSKLA